MKKFNKKLHFFIYKSIKKASKTPSTIPPNSVRGCISLSS